MNKICTSILLALFFQPLIAMEEVSPEMKLWSLIQNGRPIPQTTNRAHELIKQGVDINYKHRGCSLLNLSILGKLDNIALLLINAGARVNIVDQLCATSFLYSYKHFNGFTPLLIAIAQQQEDIAAHLLQKGANTNVQTPTGQSASSLAMQKNLLSTCQLILACKATKVGTPELEIAVSNNNAPIVALLLKKGVHFASLIRPIAGNRAFWIPEPAHSVTLLISCAQLRSLDLCEVVIKHIINLRKAAKTFMLCLLRKRNEHPCYALLYRQGKTLIKHHALAATIPYNKSLLLQQLKETNYNAKRAYDLLQDDMLNPDNIDTTVDCFLHEDFRGKAPCASSNSSL